MTKKLLYMPTYHAERERESIKDKFAQMSGKFKFPNVGKIEENCEPIGELTALERNITTIIFMNVKNKTWNSPKYLVN